MCGIVGILSTTKKDVGFFIYDALTIIQHRGQDAAGITTANKGRFYMRKGNGLVRNVFRTKHMEKLIGDMGIGHIRYPTAGSSSEAEAQPFYVNSPYGISLAHNGNLTNPEDVIAGWLERDHRRINTSSDSEALLNLLAAEIQRCVNGRVGGLSALSEEDIFRSVTAIHDRVEGSYSVVTMITGWGIVAFRYPFGIRPPCMGTCEVDGFTETFIASESVAMKALDFEFKRDILPGEVVIVRMDGATSARVCHDSPIHRPCIFEHVYFARPDSRMDGVSVHGARLKMGEKLAQRIAVERPDHQIDAVIPVPDSVRIAALELARELGVPYREGFVKNRYIGRTFIMPEQEMRKDSVRKELNTIQAEFEGKTLLIVDDSIIRGNTSRRIVEMAREAGAKHVYFASSSPPVVHPNVYGIDMPAKHEYVAYNRTVDEIAEAIGADWLIYQHLDDLVECCLGAGGEHLVNFDCSCFDGKYVAGRIDADYLTELEEKRKDSAKA